MEKFDRSTRRHHSARLKEKRKSYWGYNRPTRSDPEPMSARCRGLVLNTPKMSQCVCCSNQRKHWGRTFSEIRKHLQAEQDLDALYTEKGSSNEGEDEV